MSLPFPQKVLAQHAAVLGKTGSGKSSAMRVVVEHLLDHHKRVVIVDPKGEWWGIRSSADGQSAGYPVVTFGDFKGDYTGDVPINENSGKAVAELLTSGNRPAVIGTRGWFTSHLVKFWVDFAKTLFHTNEGELYLIIDEAQNFAPKGSLAGLEGKAATGLHWTNRLLAEGRGLGINIWVGSQRPQKVHNDTLDGCETLVAMRTVHPAARKALTEWMKGSGDKEATETILSAIGEMPRGEAYVWSPEIKFGPERVKFPMFKTFDSFQPPQLQKKVTQQTWADVDLDEVKQKLASVIREAEASDPRKLRSQIVDLQKQLREKSQSPPSAETVVETKIEKVEVPVFKDGELDALHKLHHAVSTDLENLRGAAAKLDDSLREAVAIAAQAGRKLVAPTQPKPISRPQLGQAAKPPPVPSRVMATADGEFKINGPQQRILDALAWFESIGNDAPSNTQVGAVALIDSSGGYYSNTVGPLSQAGLIKRGSGVVMLTDEGRKLATPVTNLTTLDEYHDMLRRRVRKAKSAGGKTVEMLDVLISRGGRELTAEELGKEVGIDHTGGYFSNMIGPLSTLGFIERDRGVVRPTELIFPPGLT